MQHFAKIGSNQIHYCLQSAVGKTITHSTNNKYNFYRSDYQSGVKLRFPMNFNETRIQC